MTVDRKANRRKTQKAKQESGIPRTTNKKPSFNNDINLNWFQPTSKQQLIVDSMESNDLTVVQAPSGTGKTTVAIWKALSDYRSGKYQQIILIRTPAEAGDDLLGLLKGSKADKLEAHTLAAMSVFKQFMSRSKLECDISNENVVIDIPNYLLGVTLDNAIIIVDEAQLISPNTMKLLLERAGENTKVVVIGDIKQRYMTKHREDGLKDLIGRITYDDGSGVRFSKYDNVGYVEMNNDDNLRSDLSRFILEIYE